MGAVGTNTIQKSMFKKMYGGPQPPKALKQVSKAVPNDK